MPTKRRFYEVNGEVHNFSKCLHDRYFSSIPVRFLPGLAFIHNGWREFEGCNLVSKIEQITAVKILQFKIYIPECSHNLDSSKSKRTLSELEIKQSKNANLEQLHLHVHKVA